jgi:bromodomain adjacent to zinc finger domain protein 1B
MLKVKIVKIHPLEKVDEEAVEKKSDGACDSPSSDKENSSQMAQDLQKKETVVKEDEGRRESISMYDASLAPELRRCSFVR